MKTIIKVHSELDNTKYYKGICKRCHSEFVCENGDTVYNSIMGDTSCLAFCPGCSKLTNLKHITKKEYEKILNNIGENKSKKKKDKSSSLFIGALFVLILSVLVFIILSFIANLTL